MAKDPFEYQAPTEAHIRQIQRVRGACRDLYETIQEHVPACAERTLAIRHLEEASMWANKAIVFDGYYYLDPDSKGNARWLTEHPMSAKSE